MPKEDKIAYGLYLEMCEKERQKQESLKEQYEKQLEKERKEAEDTIEFSDMRADWFFDAHIQERRRNAELMKMLKKLIAVTLVAACAVCTIAPSNVSAATKTKAQIKKICEKKFKTVSDSYNGKIDQGMAEAGYAAR